MTCCVCDHEVASIKGAAFEIIGFEESRGAGGTNHVLWRKRTGKVMCPKCVFEKKYGKPDPAQMSFA